ncbi:MAG: aminotransferase class V-fold PLP-dependent enzyme [Alsobacter sp.]
MSDDAWRDAFPVLSRRIDGRPIVYLDAAASSLRCRSSIDAEFDFATRIGANVHRGRHALSQESSLLYDLAREETARVLGAPPSCIVFTSGATQGLNLVADGLRLSPGDTVLLPGSEHHSNILPWMSRCRVAWLEHDGLSELDLAEVEDAIERHAPRLLAFSCASNVTGVWTEPGPVCALARRHGVLTVLDASQAVAHRSLRMPEAGCDFAVFSGHKVFAGHGIGVLAGRAEALDLLAPLNLGGGTVDRVSRDRYALKALPYRLEAGTPNVGGAIGLAAALRFRESQDADAVAAAEAGLVEALQQIETVGLPLRALAPRRGVDRLPILTLAVEPGPVDADHLAVELSDRYGIMVRSGYHCAHPLLEGHGVALGALRISAALYTTRGDIAACRDALRDLAGLYGPTRPG